MSPAASPTTRRSWTASPPTGGPITTSSNASSSESNRDTATPSYSTPIPSAPGCRVCSRDGWRISTLGTAEGKSCGAGFEKAAVGVLARHQGFTWVANGRFIGGFITRHYGDPRAGIHAVQMEQLQITYMDEDWPFAYDPPRAAAAKEVLEDLIGALLGTHPT